MLMVRRLKQAVLTLAVHGLHGERQGLSGSIAITDVAWASSRGYRRIQRLGICIKAECDIQRHLRCS